MVDFTRYEYQDLVERMTDKLRNESGWGDGYDSSMGQVLIQLVADTTDHLHYMLERRTTESYLYTARTRSAVVAKASERGYHYKRVFGNRGNLLVTIQSIAASNIIIPAFSRFEFDGISYISTEQVFIPTGSNSVLVPVVQGTLIDQTIQQDDLDSNGNFIIETEYDYIDNDAILLTSDNFELLPVWRTTKRAMSFLNDTDNFYDIRYGFDGMRIIFGDGRFGRKPLSTIGLKYVKVDKNAEPINTLSNVFSYDFELIDTNGTSYQADVINISRIDNGQEPESIDSIRKNATTEHNSSGRAVSNEDTIYWILNSGIANIVDVNVSGETEALTYAYNTNNIYVHYANNTNTEITPSQKVALRDYLTNLSITNPHYVLNRANEIMIAVGLSVKKDNLIDVSDADFYQILKNYLEDYFSIKKGSIGARYEHSDLIRDLYKLEIDRNNIRYKIVDFLRLDMDLVLPIQIPLQNTEVTVKLAGNTPKINGNTFGIKINDVVFSVPVNASDNNLDLLFKLRDHIFANSPYLAEVLIGDNMGTYQETFNNLVGGGLLVGVNVPMNQNDKMMGNFTIGSNIGTVLIDSPAFNLQHTYAVGLENSQGRRPIIPLAAGTVVSFTAPSDTSIRVFVRTNLNDPSTETLHFTVSNGTQFTETFETFHSVQLDYVQESSFPVTVSFNYPLVDSSLNTGLRVYTRDGYGKFTATQEGVGNISEFTTILKNIKIPIIRSGEFSILPESMSIVDSNDNTLYRGTLSGNLISAVNIISNDGAVNYRTGTITIPSELVDGEYFIKFKQDKYQNISLSENTIAKILPISETINLPNPFSFIEVV